MDSMRDYFSLPESKYAQRSSWSVSLSYSYHTLAVFLILIHTHRTICPRPGNQRLQLECLSGNTPLLHCIKQIPKYHTICLMILPSHSIVIHEPGDPMYPAQ